MICVFVPSGVNSVFVHLADNVPGETPSAGLLVSSSCLLLPSGHALLSLAVCPEVDISKGETVCA